ncbi:phospholipase D-like domain-containing protein [Paraburkholderia dilworthii]|uniref:PLD phosphodiesterase domain-containing protein n=1 Tax=Paraburkholderia dilworthii TaxID=948106 RepID=A0ABW9D186_9BURK
MRATLEHIRDRFSTDHPRHVLFTTFNFASRFFEANVLPLLVGDAVSDLKGASETHYAINEDLNTVKCLVVCDRSTCPEPKGGMRYGLLPVGLTRGRFHPKLMLMLGTLKGTDKQGMWLSVGSGNLTLSGWAINREVVGMTPVTAGHAGELRPLIEWLQAEAVRQFEFGGDAGCEEEGEVRSILGELHTALRRTDSLAPHTPGTPTLHLSLPAGYEKNAMLQALKGEEEWRTATVVSPYWSAVDTLVQALGVDQCRFVPSLGADGLYRFPRDTLNLKGHTFAGFRDDGERYTHAKALLLHNEQRRVLCIGSANFTQAAMLTAQDQRLKNIEAMLRYELGGTPDPLNALLRPLEAPRFAEANQDEEEEGAPALPPFDAIVLYDWADGAFRARLTVTSDVPVSEIVLSIGGRQHRFDAAVAGQTQVISRWPHKGAQPVRSFSVTYRLDRSEPMTFRGLITQVNADDDQLGYQPRPRLNKVLELLRGLNPQPSGRKGKERTLSDLADGAGDGEEVPSDPTFDFFGLFQGTWKLLEYYQTPGGPGAARDPYDKLAPYGAITLYRAITAQAAITHEEKIGRYIQLSEMRDIVVRLDSTPKFKSPDVLRNDIDAELAALHVEMVDLLSKSASFRSMFGDATPTRVEGFLAWFRAEISREVSHQTGAVHGR